MSKQLDKKVRDVFKDYAIDRELVYKLGVSGDDRPIPSYVLDWIITREAKKNNETTNLRQAVANFIKEHLPSKGEKEYVKHRLVNGETLILLDAIKVTINFKDQMNPCRAELPCLDDTSVFINEDIVDNNPGLLIGSVWGATKICLDEENQGIRIVDFKPMQSGSVSISMYKKCRQQFTTQEWLDLMIQTMGYNPDTYSEEEKIWLLCRLIPVVHNRVNMMELAPPGSGKSYIFNNISRHVWLTSAQITPAVLFYNRARRTPGLLTKYDLLVLDEAQSIQFKDSSEIEAQLKGYLEQGVFARGDMQATAECGMMLLANIDIDQIDGENVLFKNGQPALAPRNKDYIRKLPEMFQQSPLIDRFHGIIPGWKIPPFNTEQQAMGFGLKGDYFAAICHELRRASDIAQQVRSRLKISTGYKRDRTAVERTACGLAKLLLIDMNDPDFDKYIIEPAMEMRRLVRTQLNLVDRSLSPELQINFVSNMSNDKAEYIGKYLIVENIFKGRTSEVFKCYDEKSEEFVAIKKVREAHNEYEKRSIQREIEVYDKLKQLKLPNVLTFREVVRNEDSYCIVMEYANGGDLWTKLVGEDASDDTEEKIHPLDEQDVISICLPILDAVGAMHANEIIHRDIKPQNILCCDDVWKLADFGISKWTKTVATGYTFQGAHSAPWAPKEQIEGTEALPSADVYALGRVLAFLLTGQKDKQAINDLPDHWKDLLLSCVDEEPSRRISVNDLKEKIQSINIKEGIVSK